VTEDEIIGAVYEAVFDSATWDRVGRAFADQVSGCSCFILEADGHGSTVSVLSGHGLEVLGLPEYASYFHRLDIWKQGLLEDRGNRVVPYHQLVPQPAFQNSEIFNDWVKPGLRYEVWWGLGVKLTLSDDRVGLIGVHRPRRRGEMGEKELQAIGRFLPHLRRALRLKQSLDIEHARFATVERFCEALPKAAMLVDQHGRLVYANRAARTLLHRRDGLSLDKTGVLRAIDRAEDSALQRSIASACADAEVEEVLRIGRRSTGPLLVTVGPAPSKQMGALICATDIWQSYEVDPHRIAAVLGVTAAEARLVAALASGRTLRETAARLGIRYNTARTQLSSVLEKSGLTRQSELMLRVAALR
jgi:DNA-binding CsgD family transcriptional regulator